MTEHESNSTPRPWRFNDTHSDGIGYIEDEHGTVVAHQGDIGTPTAANEANARLIVSAVNQYDALKACAEEARGLLEAIDNGMAIEMMRDTEQHSFEPKHTYLGGLRTALSDLEKAEGDGA